MNKEHFFPHIIPLVPMFFASPAKNLRLPSIHRVSEVEKYQPGACERTSTSGVTGKTWYHPLVALKRKRLWSSKVLWDMI
jgi:hypothetical protein